MRGVAIGAAAILLALTTFVFPSAQSRRIEWKRIALPFDIIAGTLLEPVWIHNAATQSTFVGANTKGLFETRDGGDSWTRVDDGTFVTSSYNTDAYTLMSGPNGVLYSIDIGSGVYKSDDAGRHWTKAFPLSGFKGRIWIDSDRPANVSVLTARATESEPSSTYVEFKRSSNAGATFDKVDIRIAGTSSLDVSGRLVCHAINAKIECSENGTTWRTLPLTSIWQSLAIDRDLNQDVQLTINRANRELVFLSGGTLFETRGGRTVIQPLVKAPGKPGRIIDLLFDQSNTFPAYSVAGVDSDGAWKVAKIASSGALETYAGPKPNGFRLKCVDVRHDMFYVWTLEGFYRGVLK